MNKPVGFVIGKESCNLDPNADYWLIDLTVYPDTKQYGDTLTLNGIFFKNVVKTLGLVQQFKTVGKKVAFDFTISASGIQTSGCSIANSKTFILKELYVINSGEIR